MPRAFAAGVLMASMLAGCVTSPVVSIATATPEDARRLIHEGEVQLIRRRDASHNERTYVVSKDESGFVDGHGRHIGYAEVIEVGTARRRTSLRDAVGAGLILPFLLPCVMKNDRNCFQ